MSTGGITAQSHTVREKVLEMLWDYVKDNFHKFTDANKLKVVVALCPKSMPQIVEGNYNVTKMPTVRLKEQDQEIDIGNRVASHITSSSETATPHYEV